jgi:hypothetical protein
MTTQRHLAGGGAKLYNDKSEPERFFLKNQPNENLNFV